MANDFGSAYDFVVLVDRTGEGGCEILHDGRRVTFPKGKPERPVPMFLAEWLFRVDQHKVHTTDGQFVHRFGVKEGPEELLERLGPDAQDCSLITIDTTRIEGWDVDSAPDRGATRALQLARRPGDFTNDAVASRDGGGFSKAR